VQTSQALIVKKVKSSSKESQSETSSYRISMIQSYENSNSHLIVEKAVTKLKTLVSKIVKTMVTAISYVKTSGLVVGFA